MRRYLTLAIFLPTLMTALSAMTLIASAGGSGFSANPVLPVNQAPGVGGYFDLRVEPGRKQDLQVQVNNKGDKEITVTVEAITATTSTGGDVNYTIEGRADDTMRYSFADIAEVKTPRLTVPPGHTKNATITITMPEESYDGIILGSITVVKELEAEDYNTGPIVNQYSYAMAVRLTETDKAVEPEFALGDVNAELDGGIAAVRCELRNIQPLLAKGIAVHAQVTPKNGGDAVLTGENQNANMAPNSVYSFSLQDTYGRGLQPGTYVARIRMIYEGRDWNFEKEFTIAEAEAAQINENSYNQQEYKPDKLPKWLIVVFGVAGSLIILIVILLLLHIRKQSSKLYKIYPRRYSIEWNKKKPRDW